MESTTESAYMCCRPAPLLQSEETFMHVDQRIEAVGEDLREWLSSTLDSHRQSICLEMVTQRKLLQQSLEQQMLVTSPYQAQDGSDHGLLANPLVAQLLPHGKILHAETPPVDDGKTVRAQGDDVSLDDPIGSEHVDAAEVVGERKHFAKKKHTVSKFMREQMQQGDSAEFTEPAQNPKRLLVKLKHHTEDKDAKKSSNSWLRNFVDGTLDIVMAFVLMLNTAVFITEQQLDGVVANAALGVQEEASYATRPENDPFYYTDNSFLALYVLEVTLRVAVQKSEWVYSPLSGIAWGNIFDGLIVLAGLLDFIVVSAVSSFGDRNVASLSSLRLVKTLRVFKALRVVRVITLFEPLRDIVDSFVASLSALVWSMVVLFMVQMIAALVLCETLHQYVVDDSNDLETRLWVNERYGSYFKSMYTLFEITLSGGWPNYARQLVMHVNVVYAVFFIVYVTLINFALLRVITALFIKETLQLASNDTYRSVQKKIKKAASFRSKMHALFEEADIDGDQRISQGEFWKFLNSPGVVEYLSVLDVDVHDAEHLFDVLDDGDGHISIDEFCSGIARVKGAARSMDLVSLMHDTFIIQQQCRNILKALSAQSSHSKYLTGP